MTSDHPLAQDFRHIQWSSTLARLMGLDDERLARDVAEVVRVPSVTGDELGALEALGSIAGELGFDADLHEHDLDALRAHPGHPGEQAARSSLWGLTVVLPGTAPGRVALN